MPPIATAEAVARNPRRDTVDVVADSSDMSISSCETSRIVTQECERRRNLAAKGLAEADDPWHHFLQQLPAKGLPVHAATIIIEYGAAKADQ
jgi:hypothetical protein